MEGVPPPRARDTKDGIQRKRHRERISERSVRAFPLSPSQFLFSHLHSRKGALSLASTDYGIFPEWREFSRLNFALALSLTRSKSSHCWSLRLGGFELLERHASSSFHQLPCGFLNPENLLMLLTGSVTVTAVGVLFSRLIQICDGIHTYRLCVYMLCAKSLQLCPTLCDLMDCSPPGFSAHRILQAKILE